MNKLALSLLIIGSVILCSQYFKTENIKPTSEKKLSQVEKSASKEDSKKIALLQEEIMKGITSRDVQAIKENFVPDGHEITHLNYQGNTFEMDLALVTNDHGEEERFVYESDEDRENLILSLNDSDQMPELVDGEAEFLDQITPHLEE